MKKGKSEHRVIEALAASTEAFQDLAKVQRQLADNQHAAAHQLEALGDKMEELADELAMDYVAGSRDAA